MSGSVENLLFTENQLKLQLPCGIIIGGPSSSGKTTLLMKVLQYYPSLFYPVPVQIVYAYGEYNDYIPSIQKMGITVVSGSPSDEFLEECQKPMLLILDDLMLSTKEEYLKNLFTKKSHHRNIGVIFVTQNLFDPNLRVARKNSQYLILMRAPNAALDIRNLGTQLFPGRLKYFMDAYNQATNEPYGYMLIDLHASSHPILRLRTNIFPTDNRIVFIPI